MRNRVTVDSHPQSVAATWLPGLNAKICRPVIIRSGQAIAILLADDLRHAPAFPSGRIHCPNDDGSAVQLSFAYTGRAPEVVLMGLTGCARTLASGMPARQLSTKMRADLATIAPTAWRTYF